MIKIKSFINPFSPVVLYDSDLVIGKKGLC